MNQRLILLAMCLLLPACNCGGPATCRSNTDCHTSEVCSSGTCAVIGAEDGGPDGGFDGGNPDGGPCVNYQCRQVICADGGTTSISGKIYDPAGNVPLYNVIVYVPNGQPQPFAAGVTCDRCGAVTSGSPLVLTVTGPDGAFKLEAMPTGANIPLVIQIGRWRRQVTIPAVTACASNPITDVNLLRLPRNKSEGDIPQMAIATGNADPFECLLRKMGIADSEFTPPTGADAGRVHYYVENGKNLPPPGAPPASTLWTDGGTLSKYDVVMLPCEGGENPKPLYATQNIIDYTAAGGRMFTTHYGYVWIAQPFAPQPFPSTGQWVPDRTQANNPPDPYFVTLDQSFPKGIAFAQWLVNVGASQDAGQLTLHEARHNIWAVYPPTQAWMYGNINGPLPDGGVFDAVPHLTFNTPINPPPAADGGPGVQCGRVVFSDFHVSAAALSGQSTFPASCRDGGLSDQEKALEFMLFDLSSCVQQDRPSGCPGLHDACSPLSPSCCSGLVCRDGLGGVCQSTSGCSCVPPIG